MFAALVPILPPLETLVICCPPALIESVPNLTVLVPFFAVKPSPEIVTFLPLVGEPICNVVLLNTLFPAVKESPVKLLPFTEPFVPSKVIPFPPEETVIFLLAFTDSTVKFLFKALLICLPFLVTLILLSPLKITVSFLLTSAVPLLSLDTATFQLYALAEIALLIASATFLESAIPAAFAEA